MEILAGISEPQVLILSKTLVNYSKFNDIIFQVQQEN